MNRKELSEVTAECAARSERAAVEVQEARAGIEKARAGIEKAREGVEAARKRQEEAVARQEEAIARQEAATASAAKLNAKLDEMLEEVRADREDEKVWRREYLRRQEKMFQDFFKRAEELVAEGTINTEKILVAIRDQQEDTRAMKDAIFKLIDRLPPPPPHLRSA